MNNFIPHLHYVNPDQKLTPAWCEQAKTQYYYNANNKSLLWDKKIDEIKAYATGKIPMGEFKKIFKSTMKKLKEAQRMGHETEGIDSLLYMPLPLIPTPLNSAISLMQKLEVEFRADAIDPLAETKKKEDVTFLKNKGKIEADLKEVTSAMNVQDIDLGATEHSAIPFNDSPYGLDLSDPEDLDVFVNLLYKLGLESCFETLLQGYYQIKNAQQVRYLETRDHFYYGIGVNEVFESSVTGLPDLQYTFPDDLITPPSDLPDYSDRTHEIKKRKITPIELMNYFGDEIPSEGRLDEIVNGSETKKGYCECNKVGRKGRYNWEDDPTFKMTLVTMAVRSIDWIGQVSNTKSNRSYLVSHDEFEKIKEDDSVLMKTKNYAQNTYVFYWLENTEHYFGIHKLGYSTRTKGQESIQNFPHNIMKSQERSAVENSISENKDAIIANIKLKHAVLNSRPSGVYIDVKYLRNALDNLTDDADERTMDDLISLAIERNTMIGDSTGFDGKADGQQRPFMTIPGGLNMSEVQGYMAIINAAQINIASFTGINQELTGQSRDPNALIGLEKLRQQSGLNALYYAKDAITQQYQKVANQWAYLFQSAIKKGGKPKDAIIAIIGSRKVDIVKRLNEIPLHNIGITISVGIREEERIRYENKVAELKQQNVLNSADEYMLSYIPNIKDRFALLAVREKNFLKRQDKIRQEGYAHNENMVAQQGQNMQAVEQAANEGKINQIYAKGETEANLIPLRDQGKNQGVELEGLIKKGLQQDRHIQQTEKERVKAQAKADAENQKPLI